MIRQFKIGVFLFQGGHYGIYKIIQQARVYQNKKMEINRLEDLLKRGVSDVFTSEKWENFLDTMSKFYNYSPNNCMLIKSQFPTASCVASFNDWNKKFERTVNKGEKAIMIFAPIQKKYEKKLTDNLGQVLKDEDGNEITKEVKYTTYKSVPVFDVSQTSGKPIQNLVVKLEMDFEDESKYCAFMKSLIQTSPVPVAFDTFKGNVNGYYSANENKIVVQNELSECQKIKTITHEIAHALLHNPDMQKQMKFSEADKELQAESTAYIVCKHFDIDTSQYSFGYIASWSKNSDNADKKFAQILNPVKKAASEIISQIEESYDKNLELVKQENSSLNLFKQEELKPYFTKEDVYEPGSYTDEYFEPYMY